MIVQRSRPAGGLTAVLWCLALACSESAPTTTILPPPPPPPPVLPAVATVRVVADSLRLSAGTRTAARAFALDTRANEVVGRTPRWSVDNATVLAVSPDGLVTAIAPGTARVMASIDGVTGEETIQVYVPFVATVSVRLDSVRVVAGSRVQALARAFDNTGKEIPGHTVQWAVAGNPSVASITAGGLITTLAKGSATIEATVDSVTGSATIEVIAISVGPVAAVTVALDSANAKVGSTVRGTALAVDAIGDVIVGRPVEWAIVGSPAVATVSAQGVVTAVAAGSIHVSATIEGVSGLALLSVLDPPPNEAAILPELPRVRLTTTYVPATGRSTLVRAGDNLQAALNGAQRGDEIVLEAGAVFRGNFLLPKITGSAANGWVIVRSSQLAALPEGQRATSANASQMPRIETPNSAAALATALGASGWRLAGLEVTVDASFSGQQFGLVLLGDGSGAQRTAADVAADIVLDRMYIHGAPGTQLKRCVALNSARSAVVDSYLVECHGRGFDAQAILGWNGPGPYKIENNTLSGSGENVMFGGADPSISGLVPSDIEIRRNYFYTPQSWRGAWSKKNLLELKSATRLLIEANVFDGSWVDGQTGYALVLKSENQSGQCTWCRTSDVTIRGNFIRNVGAAFSLAGREGSSPNPVADLMTRVLIQNNVIDRVNVAPFLGDARFFLVQNDVRDVTIRNNTMTSTSSLNSFLYLGRASSARRFAFERNITVDGRYGLFGDALGEGTIALTALSERVSILGNAVIGAGRDHYPGGIAFVPDLTTARAIPGTGADDTVALLLSSGIVVP